MKRSMKSIFVIATLACGVSFNAFAAEGGGAPGKSAEEMSKPCAACHAADGNATNAQYPRLAGQYHDYLARALQEYKTGERQNAIMQGFVKTLSEADIQELANYYSQMPGKLDDLAHHEQGSEK
jgi:cytochrome c553